MALPGTNAGTPIDSHRLDGSLWKPRSIVSSSKSYFNPPSNLTLTAEAVHPFNRQLPFRGIRYQVPFLPFHSKLASFGSVAAERGEFVEPAKKRIISRECLRQAAGHSAKAIPSRKAFFRSSWKTVSCRCCLAAGSNIVQKGRSKKIPPQKTQCH